MGDFGDGPRSHGSTHRASALDGAILLDGNHCRVAHFGTTTSVSAAIRGKNTFGTKQGAALGFVSARRNDARHAQRCAVIVSSTAQCGLPLPVIPKSGGILPIKAQD